MTMCDKDNLINERDALRRELAVVESACKRTADAHMAELYRTRSALVRAERAEHAEARWANRATAAEAKLAEVRERCKQAMERGEGSYAYVLAYEISRITDREDEG